MASHHAIGIFVISAAAAVPLSAQTATPATEQPQREAAPTGHDENAIIVNGTPDVPASDLSTVKTMNSGRVGDVKESRLNFDASDRFARCAIRPGMGNVRLLRLALDSPINSLVQDNAQRRFVQSYAGCATDSELAGSSVGLVIDTGPRLTGYGVSAGDNKRELQSYYDRGAMFVRVVQLFGRDDPLTPSDTGNPVVQARFLNREQPLYRYRPPTDREYFSRAVCLVQKQPKLAAYIVNYGSAASFEGRQSAALIVNRAKDCFPRARQVYFDPVQLRFYLADALYRWMVAARNVDTLIPAAK